jgi:hypothetical protein
VAFDEALAERVRALFVDRPGVRETRMFGSLAFLLDGNMACCVSGEGLLVRLPPPDAADALAEPATRPFEMGGRVARGWVRVDLDGVSEDADLRRWVDRGAAHARSLPAK